MFHLDFQGRSILFHIKTITPCRSKRWPTREAELHMKAGLQRQNRPMQNMEHHYPPSTTSPEMMALSYQYGNKKWSMKEAANVCMVPLREVSVLGMYARLVFLCIEH